MTGIKSGSGGKQDKTPPDSSESCVDASSCPSDPHLIIYEYTQGTIQHKHSLSSHTWLWRESPKSQNVHSVDIKIKNCKKDKILWVFFNQRKPIFQAGPYLSLGIYKTQVF